MPLPQPSIPYSPSDVGPMDQIGKLFSLRNLMQSGQLQQEQLQGVKLENQERRIDLASQQALLRAGQDANGDPDTTLRLAVQYGASLKDVNGLRQAFLKTRQDAANADEKELANQKSRNDSLLGLIDQAQQMDPQTYQQQWPAIAQKAVQIHPELAGHINPQQPVPPQMLDQFRIGLQTDSAIKEQELKRREVAAQEQSASARMLQAQSSQMGAREDARYEQIQSAQAQKQPVSAADLAWSQAYAKRKTLGPALTVASANANRADQRSDRSYQFSSNQLDKVGQPIEAAVQRLGRLQDTLAQNSPQADALVAPELLSVMAGGQGSGLRMNEAEISRVVGGRSKWESLKAAANQWSLDPSKANSITADQRQQIRALTNAVQQKLQQKQQVMDAARSALVSEDDPVKHRQIVADARAKLTQIDAGQGSVTQNSDGSHPLDKFWK